MKEKEKKNLRGFEKLCLNHSQMYFPSFLTSVRLDPANQQRLTAMLRGEARPLHLSW